MEIITRLNKNIHLKEIDTRILKDGSLVFMKIIQKSYKFCITRSYKDDNYWGEIRENN